MQNVNDRLDRIERLLVRLCLAQPLDVHTARRIDPAAFSRPIQNAMAKRFSQNEGAAAAEAKFTEDALLELLSDDIAESEKEWAAANAQAAELIKDGKRAAAERRKAAAEAEVEAARREIEAL